MDEQEILKFIFNKVSKEIIELKLELECDNTAILEKFHKGGLIIMSEQERHSCVTHYDIK